MAKAPALKIPSSKVEIALAAGATAAAMKAAEATAGKLFMVPVGKIKPIPGFNVRVDSPDYRAHRDMIADSIEANGYDETKPLAGYVAKEGDENVIYITDGHTRHDAVERNNAADDRKTIDKLPVIVRADAPSLTDLTVALHTNNTGRPLSPFELGVVVKRLLRDEGATKESIAARLTVTPRYLDDVLLLVNSPKEIRTAVLNGQVSSTLAIQEIRKAGDTVLKAVERIQAAVDKATKSGKTKATAKDVESADEDGVKMRKVKSTVSIATGTDMKEIVKAVAAKVREAIDATAGDDDTKVASVDGTITILIEVPVAGDPIVAETKAKPAPKKAAKPKPAPSPEKDTTVVEKKAKPKSAKTGTARTKAPAKVETPAEDDGNITADDSDLGIEGAEPVSPEGQDDEAVILPPSTKGNADNDVSDI